MAVIYLRNIFLQSHLAERLTKHTKSNAESMLAELAMNNNRIHSKLSSKGEEGGPHLILHPELYGYIPSLARQCVVSCASSPVYQMVLPHAVILLGVQEAEVVDAAKPHNASMLRKHTIVSHFFWDGSIF